MANRISTLSLNAASVTTRNVSGQPSALVGIMKEKYNAADNRLFKLEEELDGLYHCSKLLREQRTGLIQGRVIYSDSSPYERTMEGNPHQLVDGYLALVKKIQRVEDAIKKVMAECTSTRSECSWLFARTRAIAANPLTAKIGVTGDDGDTVMATFMLQDMWGVMDSDIAFQRHVDMRNYARDIGLIMGVLGAGTAYSTLFSATRGRLDLISWAFASFSLLLTYIMLPQNYVFPHHFNVFALKRSTPASRRKQHFFRLIPIAVLAVVGTLLLVLSIGMSDPDAPAVSGSKFAFHLAIYPPLFALGYFLIVTVTSVRRVEHKWPGGDELPPHLPSHLVSRDRRWDMLPGGDEYAIYRRRRVEAQGNLNPPF